MMKQSKGIYVFLSHPITGIGGAELYVRDKAKYLGSEGYKVLIFSSSNRGECVIKEFLPFMNNTVPELINKPFIYSRKRREKIVSSIVTTIGKDLNVIIESSDLNSGEWGEIIASRIYATHVIFCLSEHFLKTSKPEENFLLFKHKRKELFGIQETTLPRLFHRDLPKDECYFWNASSDNSPVNIYNADIENISRNDYNIGSIGRYGKPYVPTMLADLAYFVKEHPDSGINIILCVGEHTQSDEVVIRKYFEGASNVCVYILGPINPLPVSLFKLCDVFVSTAGCAGISLRMDVPTITLDANDFKPIGVLGFTTQHTIYRQGEEKKELSDLLEDVLIKKLYEGKVPQKSPRDVEKQYRIQLNDALASSCSHDYFDMASIKLTGRIRLMKIAMLLGDSIYSKLRSIALRQN